MKRRTTSDQRTGAGADARHTSKRHHRHHHSGVGTKHHHRHKHIKAGKGRRHRLHRPPRPGTHAGTPQQLMTQAMVNRLFWRAGFGPSATDLATWTGRPVSDAVSWLLSTPAGLSGKPGTDSGSPFDPTGNDTDLVLAWVDRMIRATNPFVERLTFFWHRHWANSRESVDPPQLMITQNNLFRSYADFGTNPKASFKDFANAVSIDPSMLRYLTGELNVRGAPNENYARELMELFTLGVTNAAGQPNYSQQDVEQIAKALSGWQINDNDPNNAFSYFTQSLWYDGPKLVFGQFGNFNTPEIVNMVIARAAHPPFIVNELWSEFITQPPDAATLSRLVNVYTSNSYQLKPLLEQILSHPALFASIDEPDMIKPPVVYVVGAMRALGLGITDTTANDYLDAMGQLPYFPPNVSGWEGGLSWLNTDTALARFAFISALLGNSKITDIRGEDPSAAYDRAYAACGSPWLAPATQSALQSFAQAVPASNSGARIERQIALRTLILAGPDAQVM
jgi:uncharacterized protein DUF1800